MVVIRYEGPRASRHAGDADTDFRDHGYRQGVALITDGRFSGGSHAFIIGHVVPEAQEGGPIALIRDGDFITIDGENRSRSMSVTRSSPAAEPMGMPP